MLGMNSGRNIGKRRSIRLPGYDYRSSGAYFLTIVSQHRTALFGEVKNGNMNLNAAGRMLMHTYREAELKFPSVRTDHVICMPDHIHFILIFTAEENSDLEDQVSLSTVIQWFKTLTTNNYIVGVRENGWPRFPGRLWQRNYYEHIIRNESSLNKLRQYIEDNPLNWPSSHDH